MLDSNLSELVVVKRSGQRISFNGTKIAVAVKSAFDNVSLNNEEDVNKVYSNVLLYIENNYSDRKTINVEDIQDIIETILKNNGYIDVYNVFREYRIKRSASRDIFDRKQQHKFVRATEKLVLAANRYNTSSPNDLLLSFGKTISNEFSKAYLIDSKYVRSHDEGLIYIHDLDYYVLSTISDMFIDLSCIDVSFDYFDQIKNIIINLKKEMHGEICIPSIDYILSSYVLYKFKYIFIKNIKSYFDLEGFSSYVNIKAIENLIQKSNTISIDYSIYEKYLLSNRIIDIFKYSYDYSIKELRNDLKKNIKSLLNYLNNIDIGIDNESIISISIGTNENKEGLFIRDVYFEVLNEMDDVKISTIYKTKNIDYLEYISKLICLKKNIAVAFIPSYYNKYYKTDNIKFDIEHFSNGDTIIDNVYDKSVTSIGRMNISKTSINLVRIALISKDIVEFYNNLDNTMELVKNELLQEFEYISSKYKENFNYLFNGNYLIDNEKLENGQKIKKIIRNGTLSIGYVGLKEVVKLFNLKNKDTINIVKHMFDKCNEYSMEYKLNFSLRETNEKNILTYLKALDKSIYGSIEGVTDKDFYSVYSDNISLDDDLFKDKKIEEYSNGGYNRVINIKDDFSYKRIYELLLLAKNEDISFIRFKVIR